MAANWTTSFDWCLPWQRHAQLVGAANGKRPDMPRVREMGCVRLVCATFGKRLTSVSVCVWCGVRMKMKLGFLGEVLLPYLFAGCAWPWCAA